MKSLWDFLTRMDIVDWMDGHGLTRTGARTGQSKMGCLFHYCRRFLRDVGKTTESQSSTANGRVSPHQGDPDAQKLEERSPSSLPSPPGRRNMVRRLLNKLRLDLAGVISAMNGLVGNCTMPLLRFEVLFIGFIQRCRAYGAGTSALAWLLKQPEKQTAGGRWNRDAVCAAGGGDGVAAGRPAGWHGKIAVLLQGVTAHVRP